MLWGMSVELVEPTEWHAHEIVEFILCGAGGGRLESGAGRFGFVADRTILVPPGVEHRYVVTSDEPARLKLACLTAEDIGAHIAPSQAALLGTLCTEGVTAADHDADSIGLLAGLIPNGISNGGTTHEQQIGFGALGLLIALHAKARGVVASDPIWQRYNDRIRGVTTWIDAHPVAPLGLQELAARFGMSRTLLTREFRRHTGTSVVAYVTTRRLEQAAMALATGAGDVTAVAYASGFANLSHFHRCFKAAYGLTPAAFRRKVIGESGR
ncbi:AraC family transcriptional regulator [Rhodoplanes roseus]|nr:AraC family transcriptional regulator [Rhodoplanes roseus]